MNSGTVSMLKIVNFANSSCHFKIFCYFSFNNISCRDDFLSSWDDPGLSS